MKTKSVVLGIFVCLALAVSQAHAQYRKVGDKVYQVNDPQWGTFNCFLEVQDITGKEMICRAYMIAASTKIVTGHNINGRTAGVASEQHRVYFPYPDPLFFPFILRNSALYAKGDSIDPGTRAILVGKEGKYQVYDMGLMYIPPKHILTPTEQKEEDLKKFNELKKSAAAGNANAAYELGELYLAGKGCEVNTNLALNWFMESFTAKEGNEKALKRYKELTKHD